MRRQLPVHSPMSVRSLGAGLLGILERTPSASLDSLIRGEWGATDVLLTDSGTSSLALAIKIACTRNALVALPAFACYDLATAADGAGVRVVLYDVDPETLAPDMQSLARAMSHRPDAIVAVHLYGVPMNIREVVDAAARVGATVIEDAAQAFGATIERKRAGAVGAFGILSFGRGKGLSGGGGGALLANTRESAAQLRDRRGEVAASKRGLGEWVRASAQWLLARPSLYSVPANLPFLRLGETIYHDYHGASLMSSGARRMLRSNWDRSVSEADVRRQHAARLREAAEESSLVKTISVPAGAQPGYLRYPVRLIDAERARGRMASARRLGIMPSYPLPLSQLSGFSQRCINRDEPFTGAELLARTLVTLPTHSLLTDTDVLKLEAWLRSSDG